ncbi:MAG TPA: c-type cytochrome [Alphaproteobacteria bacterium]|nr:c-type cytochrome [Alphaproteobacteria bacterium]
MPRYVAVAACAILLVPAAARADATRGQQVFQRCAACHPVATSASPMPGPNLRGVIGRRAGTLAGFEYSSAMIDAGKSDNVVWTRDSLDKYLTDPDDVVPGTAMRLSFQLTAGERRDVIDYLEQVGKP